MKTSCNPRQRQRKLRRKPPRSRSGGRKPPLSRSRVPVASRRSRTPGRKARGSAQLCAVEPRQARSTISRRDGPEWLHEGFKFDGYRMEARLDHGKVPLIDARAGLDAPVRTRGGGGCRASGRERAARRRSRRGGRARRQQLLAAADGLEGRARRSFRLLCLRSPVSGRPDFSRVPLIERKAALARLLRAGGGRGCFRLYGSLHRRGSLILDKACEIGLEGIISKRRNAPYRSGRSDNFVKSKCRGRDQGLIVAGYSRRRPCRTPSAPLSRLSTRTASCATPAGSAPATPRRWRAICSSGCSRCASKSGRSRYRRTNGARTSSG